MRFFLIDYENVNATGLAGIGQIAKQDRVILFYSHSANTLSFEIMDEMLAAGIMPERVCIEQAGKNALDFQLVTFLGYLIAKNPTDSYCIISKDAGYQSAIHFCQEYFHVTVQLKPSIQAALFDSTKTAKAKKAQVSLKKRTKTLQVQPVVVDMLQQESSHPDLSTMSLESVMAVIEPEIKPEVASDILHCLQESHSKTEFHNALQQHFGNEDVKQYYRSCRPFFSYFQE